MKSGAFKVLVIMLVMTMCVMLTGKSDTQLSFRKVNADYTTGKLKEFVQKSTAKEGAYLYKENERTMYLLLSENKDKTAQDNPEYITKIKVVPEGNTIRIAYDMDNKAPQKIGRDFHKILYRIRLHKNFSEIKLFKNGKEIKPADTL